MLQLVKKHRILTIILTIVIILIIGITYYLNVVFPITRYEITWGIDIPNSAHITFDVENSGWFGDGLRYTELSVEKEDLYENIDFSEKDDSHDKLKDFSATFDGVVNLDDAMGFDWSSEYKYVQYAESSNEILILYDEEKSMLVLYQSLS